MASKSNLEYVPQSSSKIIQMPKRPISQDVKDFTRETHKYNQDRIDIFKDEYSSDESFIDDSYTTYSKSSLTTEDDDDLSLQGVETNDRYQRTPVRSQGSSPLLIRPSKRNSRVISSDSDDESHTDRLVSKQHKRPLKIYRRLQTPDSDTEQETQSDSNCSNRPTTVDGLHELSICNGNEDHFEYDHDKDDGVVCENDVKDHRRSCRILNAEQMRQMSKKVEQLAILKSNRQRLIEKHEDIVQHKDIVHRRTALEEAILEFNQFDDRLFDQILLDYKL